MSIYADRHRSVALAVTTVPVHAVKDDDVRKKWGTSVETMS